MCNGSTADFGSVSLGSNPGRTTQIISEGAFVPSLIIYKKMIAEKKIMDLACSFCNNKDIFPVVVKIRTGNKILVLLDGDNGVSIDNCAKLSRFIEKNLDREVEDYELEVSSFGIGNPLVLPRQYKINIGRTAKVTMKDQSSLTGTIKDANENSFLIEFKPNPKKKETQIKELAYADCLKTQIIISFK